MSMFFCQRCDQMRDSDDGCEELGKNLVCLDCYEDLMEAARDIENDDIPVNIYGEETGGEYADRH